MASSKTNLELRVSLTDFLPVSCNDEFSELLGYEDLESCLRSLSEYIHFKGCNFLQLYELTLKGEKRFIKTIQVIDRNHRPVARVTDVSIDRDAGQLIITIQSHGGGGSDQARQPVVVIDRHLNIVDLDETAKRMFDVGNTKSGFIESLVPPGRRALLKHVYLTRMQRHGVINISHETKTRVSEFDFGKWSISPDGHQYIATFHKELPLIDLPQNNQHAGGWMLYLSSKRVLCSEAWVNRLGDAEDLEQGKWQFWLESIVPEDRSHVEKVCFSPRLPNNHRLYYRLATIEGTVLPVEHRIKVIKRDRSGLPSVLSGTIAFDEREQEDSFSVDLQSIAIEHGLSCASDESISVTNRSDLTRVLEAMSGCVESGDHQVSLEEVSQFEHCSICGSETSADALSFVFHGHELSRSELMELPARDYSVTDLGGSDNWREFLHAAHQTGFHLNLSLTSASELRLRLSPSMSDSGT